MRTIWASLAVCAIAGPVAAQCFICDTEVRMTEPMAACFRENYETYVAAALEDPGQRAEVNLKTCGEGRGIDSFPSFDADAPAADAPETGVVMAGVQFVYFLDLPGLKCVLDRLKETPADAVHDIDLTTDCG